jgi:cysteine desulfurase
MRAGTENVPGIAGLAKALEICACDFERNVEHRRELRDRLLAGLRAGCDIELNGDPLRRHPGNLHLAFRRVSPQRFFSRCERIDFSTGSACNNASGEVSHVLKQLGLHPEAIKSSMRLSVGMATTVAEVDAAIEIISRAHAVATA